MLAGFDQCRHRLRRNHGRRPAASANAHPEMVAIWEQGYDDVYAKRATRGKEPWLPPSVDGILPSAATHGTHRRAARCGRLPPPRRQVHTLHAYAARDTTLHQGTLLLDRFPQEKRIEFSQQGRTAGRSSFSYMRLLDLAIEGITSYTTAPLRISTVMGIIVSAAALLLHALCTRGRHSSWATP